MIQSNLPDGVGIMGKGASIYLYITMSATDFIKAQKHTHRVTPGEYGGGRNGADLDWTWGIHAFLLT